MTESKDINQMITELYNQLIKTPKSEKKPRKMSMREYFIKCYVAEDIYRDMTPFQLTRGTINDVANLSAQATWKLLTGDQKEFVKQEYERTTDDQLEHLRSL